MVRKLALEEAHRKGVVHRDLKPANVMIDARKEPVIMDFGLARRLDRGEARLTGSGCIIGTPAYMPPEQVRGEADAVGPSSDIYSLGVILYELLAGRLPFEGDAMGVLAAVLRDEPEPPSKYRPDLDPRLVAICLKAMAKTPAGRYPSMAEFAADLGDYLKPVGETPPKRNRTAVWVACAAAGLAAAALAGVVIVIRHKDGTQTRIDVPDGAKIEVGVAPKAEPDPDGEAEPKALAEPAAKAPLRPNDFALRFDGKSSRVRVPKSSFHFPGGYSLTIEMTVIPGESPRPQTMLSDEAGSSGFSLKIRGEKWEYVWFTTKKPPLSVVNLRPVVAGRRAHVAAVFDRERRELRLLLDGKLNGAVVGQDRAFARSPWDTIIGANPQNPGNRFANHFSGTVEQLRISNVARYAKDYEPPAALEADADTLLLYRFDEGQGRVLHDASGRGSGAWATGTTWVKRDP